MRRSPLAGSLAPLLFLVGSLATGCAPMQQPAVQPATRTAAGEEEAVLGAVQRLFDAMAAKDTVAARRLLVPEGRFFAIVPSEAGDGQVRAIPHPEFIAVLGTATERWLERMWDSEVRVHGPIAMVWTPYDFYRNGEFSHCGVNAVSLIRQDGAWRISGITYTVEREGCPPSLLGPPQVN